MDEQPTIDGVTREGLAFRLRPVTVADMPSLVVLLADETIRRWWGDYPEERVRREYSDPDSDLAAYLVIVGEAVAGLIQFGEELDRDYTHASIDIAMASDFQRRGLGPAAIRVLARYLFEARGHHRISIDPAADNVNAIRAYERVGFRPVGIMRQYERGLDGTWHDGLLMDLLANELAD